jgi:hypothetical protein
MKPACMRSSRSKNSTVGKALATPDNPGHGDIAFTSMKVPSGTYSYIDLDAPTLPAKQARIRGVRRWLVWCKYCEVLALARRCRKPTATILPAHTLGRATTWRMVASGTASAFDLRLLRESNGAEAAQAIRAIWNRLD